MSKLLMDERPLIVMPSLAVQVGLPESIFLQQLHYWLDKSSNVQNEQKWVYNTVKEWQKQFPFWSESTIRRIIDKLEKNGLIISDNFNKLLIDKTKWYRINYEKLLEFENESAELRNRQSSSQNEQMDYSKRAVEAPNMNRPLPESTTKSTSENLNINNNLAGRGPIDLIDSEWKEARDFYESQGFGDCAPMIGDMMAEWIKDLSKDLVIHAMKIAVKNGVVRWSYVEKILRDWASRKIKSVEQYEALELKRDFENQQKKKAASGKGGYRTGREEKTPEWFGKDKQEEKDAPVPGKSKEEIDTERAALIKELQGDS